MFSVLVVVQADISGSYTSTLEVPVPLKKPPATSTLPLGNNVAVWASLATWSDPAGCQLIEAGSNSSAVSSGASPAPPTTSTRPVDNRVAVCANRATFMLPTLVHIPVTGLYDSALISALVPK